MKNALSRSKRQGVEAVSGAVPSGWATAPWLVGLFGATAPDWRTIRFNSCELLQAKAVRYLLESKVLDHFDPGRG